MRRLQNNKKGRFKATGTEPYLKWSLNIDMNGSYILYFITYSPDSPDKKISSILTEETNFHISLIF
jgi:hypothetical protein